jgi:Uma2 family endonuclease
MYPDAEWIEVPAATRFPIELEPPPGFSPGYPETWPGVIGRLEWVDGRLLWMPLCDLAQGVVCASAAGLLGAWARAHPDFFVGASEAGLQLGGDVRGADAAVWRRRDVDPRSPRFADVPPILAVEVSGREESERTLRTKARWYCDHGVAVVWLLLPETQEVVVLHADGEEARLDRDDRVPPHPELPGLTPRVDALFQRLA